VSRAREREDQAHRYADAGWPVFPVEPGGKRPATAHWREDATTDHRQIERWFRSEPRSNLGLATGLPGPDVVDVDKHKEGDGFAAWNRLRQAGIAREPMAIIRTPSGGFHAYYKGSEHQGNGHIKNVYVDFRSTGGYVVASPSRIAGRPYEVAKVQPSDATFDWSAAKQMLAPQPQRQAYRAPEYVAGQPKDLSHLAAWVASQPENSHNRNNALFWASCRAAEAGDAATLGNLASAARAAGLDDREIDRTISSAQRTASAGATSRPFEHPAPQQQAMAAVPQTTPQLDKEAGQ
jgi:hypothetical protein